MKQKLIAILCTCISAAFLNLSAPLYGNPQEILLQELMQNQFVGLSDNKMLDNHLEEGVIIKVEAGTKLPLKLNLKGSFISLEHSDLQAVLVVHQTFFAKVFEDQEAEGSYSDEAENIQNQPRFLFSQDSIFWYDFEDFFGGTLNASLAPDESNSTPIADLSLEVEFKN